MGEEPERLRAQAQDLATALRYAPGAYRSRGAADILDALLAEVERLAGERDEAHDKGWDEGREALLSEPVCSRCGQNHDQDESAMCEGGEVILFRELPAKCERLAGRVAALERTLQETLDTIAGDFSPVAKSRAIKFARSALNVGGSE